ncbi:MAG: hypothetical protein KGJ89_02425 [Patescibacteria group bacterium]|nr:hypothetical protein [Patescibacteria group bacterium]MDE2015734.1 hypothetical protein [Patescibacteria group bacterium]MDE2226791.1 hypothetical protein [Patescibacteria group bacterium]
MAANGWKTTRPPKRKVRPVKLRYRNIQMGVGVSRGDFVWSDRENAFLEVIEGPDGIGLYKDDGWEILGWR